MVYQASSRLRADNRLSRRLGEAKPDVRIASGSAHPTILREYTLVTNTVSMNTFHGAHRGINQLPTMRPSPALWIHINEVRAFLPAGRYGRVASILAGLVSSADEPCCVLTISVTSFTPLVRVTLSALRKPRHEWREPLECARRRAGTPTFVAGLSGYR